MNRMQWITALVLVATGRSASADDAGAQFTGLGELTRPADYRQWVFVGSGLGMAYGPVQNRSDGNPPFTNVFVNPQAYQSYSEDGRWPEGTVFILELRESEQHVSIDAAGRTQGKLLLLEASVKDSERFPEEGWAYFSFEDRLEATAPLPRDESCYSCHAGNGAVEWTFTQFYPELFELARKLGTVRTDYDPARELASSAGDRNAEQ